MSSQVSAPWLTVTDAAALVGRSLSTIRRLLPEIESNEPAAIMREPVEGKGGEKILLSRAYLVKRFGVKEQAEQESPGAGAHIVQILERQLEVKDRQIGAMQREIEAKSRQLEEAQRNAGELSENVRQFGAIIASLQNKLLSERAGGQEQERARPRSDVSEPWVFVLIAVAISLISVLVLWLVLA